MKTMARWQSIGWRVAVLGLILFVAGAGPGVQERATGLPAPSAGPKLVVVLVVDQFRADYITRFGHQWSRGLRRLVSEGAWFSRAAYPYANTVTCAGHATVATGAFPSAHGIVGNSWFDRAAWRSVACADQPGATTISYGRPAAAANGPGHLGLPTLADEMRAQLAAPTRVVTMSMKARTAIMLAGRRADSVTWIDSTARGLVTSSFYADRSVPFVEQFVRANPIDREQRLAWDREMAASRYLFADDGVKEEPSSFWTRTFPHTLPATASDKDAWDAWEASPRPDAYLARLGIASVDELGLGQRDGTDFLGISFSSLDVVGHDFGPDSHEVQDVLARLDASLGVLLDHLDRRVGRGRYVVALTGDHGVAPIPERAAADGLDAGRVKTSVITKAAHDALNATLGSAEYKVRLSGMDLHLEPAVFERLRTSPGAADAVVAALAAVPGIARVYPAASLQVAAAAGDRDARAILLSFVPDRSGQFIVVPKPNWFYASDVSLGGTSHGTPYAYDQRVPVILFGTGVRAGEYLESATPADIAPTLAHLAGVTMSRPDGRVLAEALQPRGGGNVRSGR